MSRHNTRKVALARIQLCLYKRQTFLPTPNSELGLAKRSFRGVGDKNGRVSSHLRKPAQGRREHLNGIRTSISLAEAADERGFINVGFAAIPVSDQSILRSCIATLLRVPSSQNRVGKSDECLRSVQSAQYHKCWIKQ